MAIYLTIIMHNVSTVFDPKANIIAGYHHVGRPGTDHVSPPGRRILIFPSPV